MQKRTSWNQILGASDRVVVVYSLYVFYWRSAIVGM
jgi:hypothetical protein